jgi:hypothetical protein
MAMSHDGDFSTGARVYKLSITNTGLDTTADDHRDRILPPG